MGVSLDLQTGLAGMLDAEDKLRTPQGINDPSYLSEQMMRLAQYVGIVEEYLAKLEEDYDVQMSRLIRQFMIDEDKSATAADKLARMELGPTKGRIAYLTRMVQSGWKQVSTAQSRINHLQADWNLGKHQI